MDVGAEELPESTVVDGSNDWTPLNVEAREAPAEPRSQCFGLMEVELREGLRDVLERSITHEALKPRGPDTNNYARGRNITK
jgi:hypothetical protein